MRNQRRLDTPSHRCQRAQMIDDASPVKCSTNSNWIGQAPFNDLDRTGSMMIKITAEPCTKIIKDTDRTASTDEFIHQVRTDKARTASHHAQFVHCQIPYAMTESKARDAWLSIRTYNLP